MPRRAKQTAFPAKNFSWRISRQRRNFLATSCDCGLWLLIWSNIQWMIFIHSTLIFTCNNWLLYSTNDFYLFNIDFYTFNKWFLNVINEFIIKHISFLLMSKSFIFTFNDSFLDSSLTKLVCKLFPKWFTAMWIRREFG